MFQNKSFAETKSFIILSFCIMKLFKATTVIYLLFALLFSPNAFAEEGEGEGEGEGGEPAPVESSDSEPNFGGSHELFTDDLTLKITKLVSFDGDSFFSPANPERPVAIAENQTTPVYSYVTVENLGDVSAVKIKLGHDFVKGLSDMVSNSTQLINGDVEYFASTDTFHIPKLPAKHSVSFLYKIVINELGQDSDYGMDMLTVESYESNLQIFHEGLDYVSLGNRYPSYLTALPSSAVNSYNASNGFTTSLNSQSDGSSSNVVSNIKPLLAQNSLPPTLISVGASTWMLLLSSLISFMALTLVSRVNYRRKTSASK